MNNIMINVFISYNSQDKKFAQEIALFLTAENINVWFDEWEIETGESISSAISKGLEKSSHFVLLWSKNAKASNWVEREMSSSISRLIDDKTVKIIPIRLDDTPMPTILRDIKYLRFSKGNETERSTLVNAVTGRGPTQNYLRAVIKKYKEVIEDDEKGLKACPECGGVLKWLEGDWPVCKECGWS